MKTKVNIAILLCLIVFACFYLKLKPDKLYKTPINQTSISISYILDDFDAVGLDNRAMQNLVVSLKRQSNSVSINQQLAEVLIARTNNPRSLTTLNLTNGVFHDAWGTPFFFMLTNDLTSSNLISLATYSPARPFVIWSAGPNRSNEFGCGDDFLIIGR